MSKMDTHTYTYTYTVEIEFKLNDEWKKELRKKKQHNTNVETEKHE